MYARDAAGEAGEAACSAWAALVGRFVAVHTLSVMKLADVCRWRQERGYYRQATRDGRSEDDAAKR